jgi:hypothetical protein
MKNWKDCNIRHHHKDTEGGYCITCLSNEIIRLRAGLEACWSTLYRFNRADGMEEFREGIRKMIDTSERGEG